MAAPQSPRSIRKASEVRREARVDAFHRYAMPPGMSMVTMRAAREGLVLPAGQSSAGAWPPADPVPATSVPDGAVRALATESAGRHGSRRPPPARRSGGAPFVHGLHVPVRVSRVAFPWQGLNSRFEAGIASTRSPGKGSSVPIDVTWRRTAHSRRHCREGTGRRKGTGSFSQQPAVRRPHLTCFKPNVRSRRERLDSSVLSCPWPP